VEHRDVLGMFCGWAEVKRRRSDESWLLLVEEKHPDEVVKVYLTDVCPKRLE